MLDPSLSEVADGEPLTDAGLRGVGGGGRDGLGGLEGLKPPFESDGELFPLTLLFSTDPTSSGSSDPFVLALVSSLGLELSSFCEAQDALEEDPQNISSTDNRGYSKGPSCPENN